MPASPRRARPFRRRFAALLVVSGLAALNLSFMFGEPTCYDARLDQADLNAEKAIALLMAAENEGEHPPFDNHDRRAIVLLSQARREIHLAKVYADSPCTGDH